MKNLTNKEIEDKYMVSFAASWIRHNKSDKSLNNYDLIREALNEGFDIHMFKDSRTMPRVKKVLGMLKEIDPEYHLDIGCGKGVFLWRFLQETNADVTVVDIKKSCIDRVNAVAKISEANCYGYVSDITDLDLDLGDNHDGFFDCVTALEVLEHIPDYKKAISEMVRVCNGCIIVSVPTKEDDNPEHINLFTEKQLTNDFIEAGAKSVKADYVLNSMILYVKV